jgi:hypothetical protein
LLKDGSVLKLVKSPEGAALELLDQLNTSASLAKEKLPPL